MKHTTPTRSTGTAAATPFSAVSSRAGVASLLALAALAFASAGCSSEPLSSDLSTILPETGRAIAGYNETDYVYPIRVPDTNRYVQMRTREPLGYQPTYEDYLNWKKGN